MPVFRAAVAGVGLLLAITMIPPTIARAAGCAQTVDLRERMTVANFDQAGLNQLDSGQLAALNDWLSRNGDQLCPVPLSPAQSKASPACPQPVDLRDFMTVSAFDQTGLNKLSPDQIAALNDWMRGNIRGLCGAAPAGSGPAAAAPLAAGSKNAGEAAFGAPPPPVKVPNRIESRIVGDFHGWTGNTVFKLENGQVWKQAGPGYFQTDLQNPRVVIKKLLIGYVLLVDGYGKEVFVRRIR